jgi:type I restriction enzyme R subunit
MKRRKSGEGTKVINLIKSIEKKADENSDDPFLIAMAERSKAVMEDFEQRQTTTSEALEQLLDEVRRNELRKKEQAKKGFDSLTHFVFSTLSEGGIKEAEKVSRKIKKAFVEHSNWSTSENALRELRKHVTFAIFAECDDLDQVTALVEDLFRVLERGGAQ